MTVLEFSITKSGKLRARNRRTPGTMRPRMEYDSRQFIRWKTIQGFTCELHLLPLTVEFITLHIDLSFTSFLMILHL